MVSFCGEREERIQKGSMTLVIVGGVCVVVLFSKKSSQHYTIDDLEQMFTQEGFLSVAGVLVVILLGMFLAYGPCSPRRICPKRLPKANNNNNTVQHEKRLIEAAEDNRLTGMESSNIDVPAAIAAVQPLPPLYCAFIASICSAGTNLFAKCTMAILLAHSATEWYANLTFWIIVTGLGATAVGTCIPS